MQGFKKLLDYNSSLLLRNSFGVKVYIKTKHIKEQSNIKNISSNSTITINDVNTKKFKCFIEIRKTTFVLMFHFRINFCKVFSKVPKRRWFSIQVYFLYFYYPEFGNL